ncbi:glycosyltransferase [Pelosinus sp. IPA-1]|uniref:glycosyltransferase family 2 protein n=1 Tax=Pelosinus sp. IPA-1 TaxID=3029569 RepID=UPI0024362787|nr:glycosyltransferase [Pelosinus sp. IPA-1]GMB01646.1 rhamnosyltransferase [Pelosinus sp. IPA-1]
MFKVALIIPTLNGGELFKQLLTSISNQSYQPCRKIIIDSTSKDQTVVLARKAGFEVVSISPDAFNHGLTRQQGVEMVADADIIIFLTQDAILADSEVLSRLVACFTNSDIGAAYGRQLPHSNATPLEAHARLFNYSAVSRIKSIEDSPALGIKTAFISNSFAAYRRSALIGIGGFPINTILSEDTYVAAKMLLAGYKIAYCAEAQAYHSHNYSFIQEFKRYFDIGVFQAREYWIRDKFGQAEGEGLRYIVSELKYLWRHNYISFFPSFGVRTLLKYMGYKLGLWEKKIPTSIKRRISMHNRYWK